MQISALVDNYLQAWKKLRNAGRIAKIILMLLLIPASIDGFIKSLDLANKHSLHSVSITACLIISFSIFLFWVVIVLVSNTFVFTTDKKRNAFRFAFKSDLYALLKQEIPEITDYECNLKIHPKVFRSSGLFKGQFDDYVGDDLFQGSYKGVFIELSELHVIRLLKTIFSGIFIHCRFEQAVRFSGKDNAYLEQLISDFEEKYNATILISSVQNHMYFAVNKSGHFFENNSEKQIRKAAVDVVMLKDLIGLIKKCIEIKGI